MFVKNILAFIDKLKGLDISTPCDKYFCKILIERFVHRLPEDILSVEDIRFLKTCFKKRSEKILGYDYDYMLNVGMSNQLWIQLSKDLGSFTSKSYLKILLPNIINTVDYNNISLLTETNKLENFYLGQGDKVLYRKRGLSEHLIKNQFYLSTCRDLNSTKLSAVSVDEITRLLVSRDLNGRFSIKEDLYESFWDFLQKKVFPLLQSRGSMPIDLLPHLLILIEQYYRLKNEDAGFKQFSRSIQHFFKCIYLHKLEDINYFYGIEIEFKGKKYYLLELLAVINKSQSYVLDEHLNALLEWLYNFHPTLKSTSDILKLIYSQFKKRDLDNERGLESKEEIGYFSKKHCLNMLLSLMTTNFDLFPLSGTTISIWDLTNDVFYKGCEIFSSFEAILNENREDDLCVKYQEVLNKYIIPAIRDNSLFTWFMRSNSLSLWYQYVETDSLSKIGVNWFQPELLMHTLSLFRSHDLRIANDVNSFLDEIIHTYAQKKDELLKQFRVNILFSNFMKKLPDSVQKHLMILIQLCEKYDVKDSFMSNCIFHIVNQLSKITGIRPGRPVKFFVSTTRIDSEKLVVPYVHLEYLNKVIDAFKDHLYSSNLNLNPGMLDEMTKYLRSLSRPIYTVQERQENQNNSTTPDYLGAPT